MSRPVLTLVPTIAEITAPLRRFGISYFSYAKIESNTLTGFLNNLTVAESTLKMGAYKSNFLGDSFTLAHGKKHIFLMEKAIEGTFIGNESIRLLHQAGVGNVLGIAERIGNTYHIFYFGTNPHNTSILAFYFNNLDILFNFISFFVSTIAGDKNLREGLNDKINFVGDLNQPSAIDLVDASQNLNQYYSTIQSQKFYLNPGEKKYLTDRELDCLALMRAGLRTKTIASILELSTRTIEEHILKMKQKLECATLIQVGEKIIDLNLGNLLTARLALYKID